MSKYEFYSGNLKNEEQADMYAKAYVDDYAFKTQIFSKPKVVWWVKLHWQTLNTNKEKQRLSSCKVMFSILVLI